MFKTYNLQTLICGFFIVWNINPALAGQFNVLAISWQAAFCETRPDRPECRTQRVTRYDGSHFSLHGLWPQPRSNVYCGIQDDFVRLDKRGKWGQLPDLNLSKPMRDRLNKIMPGTRSFLQRHEWIKHGSCHENGSAKGYFADSLALMNELENSALNTLFATHIGKYVSAEKIQKAFDRSFGGGVGKRIKIQCIMDGKRKLISQITLGLYGEIDEQASLSKLMLAARPTSVGCRGGFVDPVGLQ